MNSAETSSDQLRVFVPHQIVDGIVTQLTDDTAFVDVAGVVGMVCAELGRVWPGRGRYPWPFTAGYQGPFSVLGIDQQKNRLSLAYVSPESVALWAEAPHRFPLLSRHQAEIVAVLSSAVAVSLGGGVSAWLSDAEIQRLSAAGCLQRLSVGDTVEITVLDVDPDRMRMLVGLD